MMKSQEEINNTVFYSENGIVKVTMKGDKKLEKVEISKENFSKIFMGTRSQFRKQGKPVINMNNERKLYNSNVFYRK